jgi:hypothetical protein
MPAVADEVPMDDPDQFTVLNGVVADQSADPGAVQKLTLMSDAEMASVVAGTGPREDFIPIVVPGVNFTNTEVTVLVPETAALNFPHD